MIPAPTRRQVLRLCAAAPLAAALPREAFAAPTIGQLIAEAQAMPRVAQRMAFISAALRGRPYRANTLIGGPGQEEQFVVRDDVFDCVTFCEVVLAAALSRDMGDFEAALKRIRYEHGRVKWDERNHYFAEWSRRAVENGICRPVRIEPSVRVEKTVDLAPFGRRRIAMDVIPRASLVAGRHRLAPGDIVGFVSRRSNLDFYHTGLIAFGPRGEWLLRHASQSRRRILDERMERFIEFNGVRFVTLLRANDAAIVADRI